MHENRGLRPRRGRAHVRTERFHRMPTLAGARVRLRPLRANDADDLFALHSDPRVMRYWSHAPWTEREQAVARIAQLERDRANAEFYTWAIDDRRRRSPDRHGFAVRDQSDAAARRSRLCARVELVGTRLCDRSVAASRSRSRSRRSGSRGSKPTSIRATRRRAGSSSASDFVREGLLRNAGTSRAKSTDSAMYGLLRSRICRGGQATAQKESPACFRRPGTSRHPCPVAPLEKIASALSRPASRSEAVFGADRNQIRFRSRLFLSAL